MPMPTTVSDRSSHQSKDNANNRKWKAAIESKLGKLFKSKHLQLINQTKQRSKEHETVKHYDSKK